jgi:multiple antibiotic resistance protein
MKLNFVEIIAAFMVLFAIIDITGSIPIILDIKAKGGKVEPLKASLAAFIIFMAFLFLGEPLLGLFGVDISSFAIAGSLIVFFLGLEMVMGHTFFKNDPQAGGSSIVPIAFPLVAGAGSITTLLSIRAEYAMINITIALVLNILIVYVVLRATSFFERWLGPTGLHILRKAFGIILIAIAIKLFLTNTGIHIEPVR